MTTIVTVLDIYVFGIISLFKIFSYFPPEIYLNLGVW